MPRFSQRLGVLRVDLERPGELRQRLIDLVRVVVADREVRADVGVGRRDLQRRLVPPGGLGVVLGVEVQVGQLRADRRIGRLRSAACFSSACACARSIGLAVLPWAAPPAGAAAAAPPARPARRAPAPAAPVGRRASTRTAGRTTRPRFPRRSILVSLLASLTRPSGSDRLRCPAVAAFGQGHRGAPTDVDRVRPALPTARSRFPMPDSRYPVPTLK